MHLRQFVRCWLTLSDFHCVSVSGPSRSFVDNGMSFIFWKVWPTAFRFRLQRLFLHNLFFEVCPAFASLSFVWVVLFRMPKDFTLSNWVLGLKISQLWFHYDQCKRTCICKTRRFFNKANSLTDPSNENIYTKNCHLNKCHKNVFLWLFLTYTVQTPLALRPFINHIMQILDLSHFNDPFVGFNSLAWGHFQCDVCVVFFFGFSHSHEGWFFLNAFAYLGISCEPLPLSDWSTFPFFCFYCGRNTEDPSLKIFLEVVIAKWGRDEKEKLWHKQLGWKSGIEWGIGLEDQRLGSNCDLGRGEVPILAHFDLHRIVWWFFFTFFDLWSIWNGKQLILVGFTKIYFLYNLLPNFFKWFRSGFDQPDRKISDFRYFPI